jgi:hypothetical protein
MYNVGYQGGLPTFAQAPSNFADGMAMGRMPVSCWWAGVGQMREHCHGDNRHTSLRRRGANTIVA